MPHWTADNFELVPLVHSEIEFYYVIKQLTNEFVHFVGNVYYLSNVFLLL